MTEELERTLRHYPFIVSWVTASDLSLDLAQGRGAADKRLEARRRYLGRVVKPRLGAAGRA